jgi:hypothetical protein
VAKKDFRMGAKLEALEWQVVSVFSCRRFREKAPPLRRLFNPFLTPFRRHCASLSSPGSPLCLPIAPPLSKYLLFKELRPNKDSMEGAGCKRNVWYLFENGYESVQGKKMELRHREH